MPLAPEAEAKMEAAAAIAAKEFQVTWSAEEVAKWFNRNRMASYKRLVRILYQAFGLS